MSSSDEEDSSDCDVNMNLKNERLYQKTPVLSQQNAGESSVISSCSWASDLDAI